MEGFRRRRIGTVHREIWRVQSSSKRKIEERERLALRNKVKEEKYSRDTRGVEEIYWNENVSARPNLMDYAKKLKLRFRVRDLDLPERRKRYTSSREEEDMDAHMCRVAQQ